MTAAAYNLTFLGPFGLVSEHERCIFRDKMALASGIYIYAVPYLSDGFLVTYVGETGRSFGQKITEYMIHFIGGYDRISDPEGTPFERSDKIYWGGLWGKGTKGRIEE